MARSRRKQSRRWILGILLAAVSCLTLLSLTPPGPGSMTGPFGRLWVGFWTTLLGIPGMCLMAATGMAWGVAFLAPLQRRRLAGLTLCLPLFIVIWDAFSLSFPSGNSQPQLHGFLAEKVQHSISLFFGPAASAQHLVALGGLGLTATVLMLRWGLPLPVGRFISSAISFLWRSVYGAVVFSVTSLWRLLSLTGSLFTRGVVSLSRLAGEASSKLSTRLEQYSQESRARRARTARKRAPASAEQDESATLTEEELLGFTGVDPATVRTVSIDDKADVRLAGTANSALDNPDAPEDPEITDSVAGDLGDGEASVPVTKPKRRRRASNVPDIPDGAPALAPVTLLAEPVSTGEDVSDEEIRLNARILKETLASFDIQGEISDVHPGPVITRYEFTPGVGVTISKIVSRQNDLALAMRAPSVRLLAPIPGKAAVGVEIPNKSPALISFKELAATRPFLETKDPLAVALGKDVAGRPFYTSLDKMPHLLVAGTTGSGKSVCMNTLIVSLLMRCTPDKLRIVMIDPKMLEFTMYNDIPHLARPVVTDASEAARVLTWLTTEMARRYRVLAGIGVRNILGYEKKREERSIEGYVPEEDEAPLDPMPYIVVFVDELADLMITNQSEIELPIARLAQMARAVGIHLVLATQRPSVDVITGVIKANFPARIAFQVASRTDSRTILDMNGAESLLGRGDMLFIPPGKSQAHRIHGGFLSDDEIERIVGYLKQFPEVDPLMGTEIDENPMSVFGDQDDSLFQEALKIVVTGQQGSTSMLQRRLRIGYTRAGRLMDMLESAGIVGPPDGSRARDVLVPPEYLDRELAASAEVTSR